MEKFKEQFYLFLFADDSYYEMTCGISFKDAVQEMSKYTNTSSELLFKALRGFGSNDIYDIIQLYNHFTWKEIKRVYTIDKLLYSEE